MEGSEFKPLLREIHLASLNRAKAAGILAIDLLGRVATVKFLRTEMNAPLLQNPELNAQFLSKIPLGRWGQVDEVGKLALYLCSEEAGFITGTDILMDGGWTAQ